MGYRRQWARAVSQPVPVFPYAKCDGHFALEEMEADHIMGRHQRDPDAALH